MKLFKKFTREFEEERYSKVDELIDEIFELTKEFSNDKGEYPRSFHKFKNDIFYLDSARYEIEVTLNRLGKDIDKYYNHKYKSTKQDTEEDGCFANSMGAFLEIFENFKKLYRTSSKYDYSLLNKVCDKCCGDLQQVINILGNKNEITTFLNETYATADKKKREYKECLDYVTKEKIINEMHKIVVMLKKSCEVLPGHIDDYNFKYAKMTANYIEEECNNLKHKLENFNSYKETVEDERKYIDTIDRSIDKILEIKKPLEVDISIIKMNYKCGQPLDRDSFEGNVNKLNKEIENLKKIINSLWEQYKRLI